MAVKNSDIQKLNTHNSRLDDRVSFFIDIDGLYSHLRAQKSKRHPHKFRQFRTLTHHDLSKLFKQFDKVYHKGRRCHGLISALNMEKLVTSATELETLVNTNPSNYLA